MADPLEPPRARFLRPRLLSTSAVLMSALLVLAGCQAEPDEPPSTPTASDPAAAYPSAEVDDALASRETEYDARIGVSLIDLEDGGTYANRESERFGFASTIKTFTAADLLDSTTSTELEERVRVAPEDVDGTGHSPVTEDAVGTEMSLSELAEASVRFSDNAATNLVFDHIGGPSGLGDALAEIGDSVTRPVDVEPGLNDVASGEDANTTTPKAFAGDLERIVSGDWLEDSDQELLFDWMSGNATGDPLIRAGAPEGWEVADKSGGAGATRNDIAVLDPPEGDPVVLVVLTARNDPDEDYEDALVAEAARVVLGPLTGDR